MNTLFKLVTLALLITVIIACATNPRRYPAPDPGHYVRAEVSGFSRIRFWADQSFSSADLDRIITERRKLLALNPQLTRKLDILALSGGGEDGAYGAGFLNGWTERGDRPEFTMVTGVSTGALIAPFAFLGPRYDDALKRFYTEISVDDIVSPSHGALFGGASLGDTTPLQRILEQQIDYQLVAEIAKESRRGRMLFISTTNLDAQRSVIWDIGRIAQSGHQDAAALIRQIMLASAAIPGAFPPVTIDVIIDGVRHQELHVDGGVTHGIFVYPPGIPLRRLEKTLGLKLKKNYWLIRNSKIDPEYKKIDPNLSAIAGRAIITLLKYQGRGDLIALKRLAERDGFDFNLTYVPAGFKFETDKLFDRAYMQSLYDVGYRAALAASPWNSDLKMLASGAY